jgi:hypothetical protein
MSALCIEELNRDDPAAIADYERALYRAFEGTEIRTLDKIWEFDHAGRRLRARIPYVDQRISAARFHGAIIAGVAVNVNMRAPLQLETMGFHVDTSRPGVCEGLGIFSLQVFAGATPVAFGLRDHAFARLHDMGIRTTWGTCSRKKLRGYQLLGFSVIDQRLFCGEEKFLLEYSLPA